VPHDVTLIATMAAGLAFAFAGGLAAARLRLPPILGYVLAGVAVGPFRRATSRTRGSRASSPRSASCR
jgi:predicted Kef-type K+ transport protein